MRDWKIFTISNIVNIMPIVRIIYREVSLVNCHVIDCTNVNKIRWNYRAGGLMSYISLLLLIRGGELMLLKLFISIALPCDIKSFVAFECIMNLFVTKLTVEYIVHTPSISTTP